jgi:ergothioneine biosynthesis protein EgtB
MPVVQSDAVVHRPLLERMSQARDCSDALFRIVQPDSIYARPIPERHRIIFYIGHVEAFDWNLLHRDFLGLKSFHPEFDRLFAFGIDPVGGGLPTDKPADWPAPEAVRSYVNRVRNALDEKLADVVSAPHAYSRDGFAIDTLLNVAIEHRLMHVETLAYMLHQLPLDQKIPQRNETAPVTEPMARTMVEIPAGAATLGLARGSGTFGWDNEYAAHTKEVPAFEIDQYMVTNGNYLDFVNAANYEERSFWTDDDWHWRTAHDISHPAFWKRVGGEWLYRTMFTEIPLPLDWPVYVSHAEASAYAKWARKSLPTEEEWHRAAYGTEDGIERCYPWGSESLDQHLGNFDLRCWDPVPVNAFPGGASAFGVRGMLGNGWEWTSSEFAPYPGFQPFPFYRGYSADFFDGKHFVLKGGSARTAACMVRRTFRNWFQPHYPYVYAGFRCVNR